MGEKQTGQHDHDALHGSEEGADGPGDHVHALPENEGSDPAQTHMCMHEPELSNRRGFLKSAAVTAGAFAAMPVAQHLHLTELAAAAGRRGAAQRDSAKVDPIRLILLGTAGGGPPVAGRTGIASALVVDDDIYLVDTGRGALTQFTAAGLALDKLKGVFVTHLHGDHVVDLFSFFVLNQATPPPTPTGVWGPGRSGNDVFGRPLPNPVGGEVQAPGTTDLLAKSIEALSFGINSLNVNIGALVQPHDIPLDPQVAGFQGKAAPDMSPFTVMEDDKVKVTAVLVPHAFPSFAYRFDTAAGSFVFSGDTGRSGNVVRLATDADVLVHEVADAQAQADSFHLPPNVAEFLKASFKGFHTESTEVGSVANDAGAKTLVLSHYAPANYVSPKTWLKNAQVGYDGKVIAGEDLMVVNAAGKQSHI